MGRPRGNVLGMNDRAKKMVLTLHITDVTEGQAHEIGDAAVGAVVGKLGREPHVMWTLNDDWPEPPPGAAWAEVVNEEGAP
jgi:hypothetical protein